MDYIENTDTQSVGKFTKKFSQNFAQSYWTFVLSVVI